MKKKSQRIFLFIILFFTCITMFAQKELENISIPSPTSVALAKYGDVPTSLYTGRAHVSVPIFNTQQDGVTLDVNITYDTSGLIVTSLPGWTGYGWTLNAGGVITRVINRRCDEYDYSETSDYKNYINYFSDPSRLNNWVTDLYDNGKLKDKTVAYKKRNEIFKQITIIGDSPDIFYFNFMGKTGRFFYGQDSQWHVLSDENLKVEFDVKDNNNYIRPYFKYTTYKDNGNPKNIQMKTIKGFTIIDENGIRYIFGDNTGGASETSGGIEKRANAIEYSCDLRCIYSNNSFTSSGQSMNATAWYLTEIKNRHGKTLYKFDYQRGKFIVHINKMLEKTTYSEITYYPAFSNNDTSRFPFSISFNSPVYLKKITMPQTGEELEFEQSNSIELTSDDVYKDFYEFVNHNDNREEIYGELERRYDVSNMGRYEYLFPLLQTSNSLITPYQSISNTNKTFDPIRSMAICPLERIDIKNNDHIISSRKLEYTDVHTNRMLLTKMTIADENDTNVGQYDFSYYKPGQLPQSTLTTNTDSWGHYTNKTDKTPNLEHSKFGMLTQIKYPTGGITEIEYGLHKYVRVLSDDRQSVNKEEGFAGGLRVESISNYTDADKTVLFKRHEFTYENGELMAKPKHQWNWSPENTNGAKITLSYEWDNSIIPLYNSFGSHIGYSDVTESYNDGSYKKYKYTNFSSSLDYKPVISAQTSVSPFDTFSERGYLRGKLLQEYLYNSSDEMISFTEYVYRMDNIEKDYVYTSNLQQQPSNSHYGVYYTGGITKMFYPKYDIEAIYKTIKQGGIYDRDVTIYHKSDYNINGGIIRKCDKIEYYRANGNEQIVTEYSYPEIAQNEFCNKFFFPCVATAYKRAERNKVSNQTTMGTIETTYGYKNGLFVPIEEKKSVGNGDAYTYLTYDSYLPDGRIETFSELGKCQSKLFYDSKKRLIARVTCAAGYSDVKYNENTTSPTMIITKGEKSIFEIPTTEAIVYTYNEKGMVNSITTGYGNTQYYIYDAIGQLCEIRDNNNRIVKKFSNNVINK